MSNTPNRICRVGGRRPWRTELQHPYYRPHNRPLDTESCALHQIDDRRQRGRNKWSSYRVHEDAIYPSASQSFESDRSRNTRHFEQYSGPLWSPSRSPSHSTLRNHCLSNSHQDFPAQRADDFHDWIRQRPAELAHPHGNRIQSTMSKARENRTDQQNFEFGQQQTGLALCSTEMPASLSRKWSDMVELEELAAEQQNSEFEAEYNWQCPEQMEDEFQEFPVLRHASSHMRQSSMMSNSSSLGSDPANESQKVKMSRTPRFTESELDTKEVQVIIARRKKQIQYGKVLDCYHRYIQVVPRCKRTMYHPRTPDIYRNYSRRGFDTLVRTWKKQLHVWDPVDVDSSGRSMKLGSTCESSIASDATLRIKTCKTEVKEDLDDYDYDSDFPPLPTSADVKPEAICDLPSVCSSTTVVKEDIEEKPLCGGVVVKTEKPDDYFQ